MRKRQVMELEAARRRAQLLRYSITASLLPVVIQSRGYTLTKANCLSFLCTALSVFMSLVNFIVS